MPLLNVEGSLSSLRAHGARSLQRPRTPSFRLRGERTPAASGSQKERLGGGEELEGIKARKTEGCTHKGY